MGYGFVTYESEAEAQKAIEAMDGRVWVFSCITFFLKGFMILMS